MKGNVQQEQPRSSPKQDVEQTVQDYMSDETEGVTDDERENHHHWNEQRRTHKQRVIKNRRQRLKQNYDGSDPIEAFPFITEFEQKPVPTNTPRNSATAEQPSKWCKYHKTASHDNNECKAQLKNKVLAP